MTWDPETLSADVSEIFEVDVPASRWRNAATVREYGEPTWRLGRAKADPWEGALFEAWAAAAAVEARQQLARAAAERRERWPHCEDDDRPREVKPQPSVEAVLVARSLRAIRRVRGFTPGVRPVYTFDALPVQELEPCACGARRELRLGLSRPPHIGRFRVDAAAE